MNFGWINYVNMAVIAYLILINVITTKKRLSHSFNSKHLIVNILEQIGRDGSMVFMIFPISVKNWKFGFQTVAEMFIWLFLTVLLLLIYTILWFQKAGGGACISYELAIIPTVLFLLNGLLLQHPALIVVSVIFGIFHIEIVRENV